MENFTSIEASLNPSVVFSSEISGNGNSMDQIDEFIEAYIIGVADRLAPKLHTQPVVIELSESSVKTDHESSKISPAKQERLRLNKIWQLLTRYESMTTDNPRSWHLSSVAKSRKQRRSIHQAWLTMRSAQNRSLAV